MNKHRERLDDGIYDIKDNIVDVHTACGLMKLFLREMPEPLIPTSYYEASTKTPEKAMEIVSQLPLLNQKMIAVIVSFLRKISADIQTVEITRMNRDNLSMVFAPSFLRCPYDDYNLIFAAAEKEKAFVLSLLASLPDTPLPDMPLPTLEDLQTKMASSADQTTSLRSASPVSASPPNQSPITSAMLSAMPTPPTSSTTSESGSPPTSRPVSQVISSPPVVSSTIPQSNRPPSTWKSTVPTMRRNRMGADEEYSKSQQQ